MYVCVCVCVCACNYLLIYFSILFICFTFVRNHCTPVFTRSSAPSRTEPSSRKEIIKIKCIICCKTQHGGIRDKFRMSECPRAQKFIKVTMFFQDDVYARVADLEDERSVFGADLYYHKVCLESYLQNYFRATNTHNPN